MQDAPCADASAGPEPPDLGKHAAAYHTRGWSIIAVGVDKKPIGRWKGYQKRRATAAELAAMCGHPHAVGLAVILGTVSGGLACRDFDIVATYEAWCQAHPYLAASLPTVRTPGGYHVYASVAAEGFYDHGDGEYRADSGHYCILPPSMHASGLRYKWVVPLPHGELPLVDPVAGGFVPEQATLTQSTRCASGEDAGGAGGLGRAGVLCQSEALCQPPGDLLTDQDVIQALNDAMPDGPHRRHAAVFALARTLRSIETTKRVHLKHLRPVVAEWHRRAKRRCPRMRGDFFDCWADFANAFPKVKHAKGESKMDRFIAVAEASDPPGCAEAYGDRGDLKLLIAVCRELHRDAEQDPKRNGVFFLTVRAAAHVLRRDRTTAGQIVNMLVVDGILELVSKGARQPGQRPRGSEFRYLGN